jgi:hypothetical protein
MAGDMKTQARVKTPARALAALEVGALLLLASAAFAGPPPGRLLQPPTQHLDLRLPSHAAEGSGNVAEKSPSAFPSMAHRQNLAQQNLGQQERGELAALGSDGMHARPTLQEYVQRVHREGLPVARLFENKSALVHLGLSPKGKPGLWLVQKTH